MPRVEADRQRLLTPNSNRLSDYDYDNDTDNDNDDDNDNDNDNDNVYIKYT